MSIQSDRPGLVADLFAIVVREALIGVDLSVDEWVAILNAHNGGFSTRRAWFHESARFQIDRLASGVYDEDDGTSDIDAARRIEALPLIQKVAVLDVIDRFWSPDAPQTGDLRTRLQALGVVFPDTAHVRLRAAAAQASWPR